MVIYMVVMKCLIGLSLLICIELLWRSHCRSQKLCSPAHHIYTRNDVMIIGKAYLLWYSCTVMSSVHSIYTATRFFIDTQLWMSLARFIFLCFFFCVQELQFLDLTDADEEECDFLRATLFSWNPNSKYPELPWTTQADFSSSPTEWRPTRCGK
jgi:hypothetical protein